MWSESLVPLMFSLCLSLLSLSLSLPFFSPRGFYSFFVTVQRPLTFLTFPIWHLLSSMCFSSYMSASLWIVWSKGVAWLGFSVFHLPPTVQKKKKASISGRHVFLNRLYVSFHTACSRWACCTYVLYLRATETEWWEKVGVLKSQKWRCSQTQIRMSWHNDTIVMSLILLCPRAIWRHTFIHLHTSCMSTLVQIPIYKHKWRFMYLLENISALPHLNSASHYHPCSTGYETNWSLFPIVFISALLLRT